MSLVRVPIEVTATLVADVAKHYRIQPIPKPKVEAYTPGRCVHTEHLPDLGLFRCEKPVEDGWLCPEHAPKVVRRYTGQTLSNEVDCQGLNRRLEQEILSRGGTRLGSHQHLMLAIISTPSGEEKFPQRWDPSIGAKLVAPEDINLNEDVEDDL